MCWAGRSVVNLAGREAARLRLAQQSNFTIAGLNLTPDTKARTALPVRTHADETAPLHSFELSDLLQLGAFRVSLRHDGDEARGEGAPTAGEPSNWAIWGRGNVRGFASETDAGLELDGNAYAGWLAWITPTQEA